MWFAVKPCQHTRCRKVKVFIKSVTQAAEINYEKLCKDLKGD
jgi:hypothetical protein